MRFTIFGSRLTLCGTDGKIFFPTKKGITINISLITDAMFQSHVFFDDNERAPNAEPRFLIFHPSPNFSLSHFSKLETDESAKNIASATFGVLYASLHQKS